MTFTFTFTFQAFITASKKSVCMCAKSLQLSDFLQPYRTWHSWRLCSWDSPDKNTGVGCHAFLQWIFLTQDRTVSLTSPALHRPLGPSGKPSKKKEKEKKKSSMIKKKGVCLSSRSVMSDLHNPMDYSLSDSSVLGIFQARLLEWVAIFYSRGSW